MNAPHLVFMYPSPAAETVKSIEANQLPRERLTGFYQLKEKGWDVSISDARWLGTSGSLRKRLRRFIELPSIRMIQDWLKADVVVVKDDFSLTLTLLSKMFGRKIIYLDSMFRVPKRKSKKSAIKMSLLLADGVVTFSQAQAAIWSREFNVPAKRFHNTKYCVDTDFYTLDDYSPHLDRPYVLAVGRDLGRDFSTLIQAIERTELTLKIVAPPYLLPAKAREHPKVEILEKLSYTDLFSLYKGAIAVSIPLKRDITYPSGIRAAMEALSLGVPTVCSWTPVIEEYFPEGRYIEIVEPENPVQLSEVLTALAQDEARRSNLGSAGRKFMREHYDIAVYGEQLEQALTQILGIDAPRTHLVPTSSPASINSPVAEPTEA